MNHGRVRRWTPVLRRAALQDQASPKGREILPALDDEIEPSAKLLPFHWKITALKKSTSFWKNGRRYLCLAARSMAACRGGTLVVLSMAVFCGIPGDGPNVPDPMNDFSVVEP